MSACSPVGEKGRAIRCEKEKIRRGPGRGSGRAKAVPWGTGGRGERRRRKLCAFLGGPRYESMHGGSKMYRCQQNSGASDGVGTSEEVGAGREWARCAGGMWEGGDRDEGGEGRGGEGGKARHRASVWMRYGESGSPSPNV